MSEKREYSIPDTEYYAVLKEGRQKIYDCDGDVVAEVPAEWNEHELDIWGNAYEAGMERGERWGESDGEYRANRQQG